MQLYNTLTRTPMKVEPIQPGKLTLYTCGPTVYQEPHIGNWRMFIFYDTLARTLRAAGYQVEHVLNITDVGHLVSDADSGEDKLERQAKQERRTAWEIATEYTTAFTDGLKVLNIDQSQLQLPRATDHIADQIELIQELEAKGVTYRIGDGIYFDTTKADDYGKLMGPNFSLEQQQAGARVEANPEKRAAADFALWKFSPPQGQRDMEWDSPWGKGFPGWHLECSAMARRYLGPTLDLHAGGIDHIGVHHTNEIAQSETATGRPLSHIWLHANFMLVDGQKMAKSLGNTYVLADLEQHGHRPLALRLLCLQSHYRSELNFTWDSLAAADRALSHLYAWADQLHQPQLLKNTGQPQLEFDRLLADIQADCEDDLNTPAALAKLFGLVDQALSLEELTKAVDFVERLFGLGLTGRDDITAHQKKLINEREQARQKEDWAKSDEHRTALLQDGLEILDTPAGPRWQRTP